MTTETATPHWIKSSYSNNGGTCVEWAPRVAATTGTVPVRDSKSPAGPVLNVSAAAFAPFVAGVKSGQLSAA
ncbi:DUF397 domain-containing protein [Streptomyces sp. GSL17-111]|uniref:DUF397 domain-containing protein n=1 Tax=Streptomyces sp. GSL17-111 TaxID=3121596 RepID=UPI0030F3B3D4